ncbi:MAG: DUF2027 domain-containing protein [Bacteroidia bacterium]
MNLRAGDKVRFLDEKGEGMITRFLDRNQALVQMTDGFEIPYLISKLVHAGPPPATQEKTAVPSQNPAPKTQSVEKTISSQGFHTEGVYLVYLPVDAANPLNGLFEALLFNLTAYHIHFVISSREMGKYSCLHAGGIAPGKSISLQMIGTEDMEAWSSLLIDILFYSYSPAPAKPPLSRIFRQKPARFFKDGSFSENGLTAEPAIVVDLTRRMQHGQEEEFFEEGDLEKILSSKEQAAPKKRSLPSTKNNPELEWEVDLHLEELTQQSKGMNNAQMLDIQLRHFQKKLDEAIGANIRKIVFIHGVGNGRLKQEIRKILSTHRDLAFHDASYSQYGFGATEVLLW